METLGKTAPHVVQKGHKLFTIDLEKAYYKLFLSEDWHPWLCFHHRGKFYASRVLLFGLGPAPFWFTKINRPTLAFFRILLIAVINYIDDWLFSENMSKAQSLVSFTQHIFSLLGWLLNEKCRLIPADIALFLGLLVDTEHHTFVAPDYKLARV